MTRLTILALAALSCWSQVTPSPATLTFYMRQGQNYPWNSTLYPVSKTITVTGSGSWTATRSGTLTTACGGPCFAITPTSGTGSGTVTVNFSGSGAESLAAGTYTGTVTVGATAVPITLEVRKRLAYDPFVYQPGYPSGCANTSTGFPHADTCTITSERPASTAFSIPAPGGSYVDPQFGGTVVRLTGSGSNIQYGALSAFSATAKYILTSDRQGYLNIYNVATRSIAYGNLSGMNINFSGWDPDDDERLWYMDGATIRYRTLNTGTTTVAADYTNAAGSRPPLPGINMGGTVDITDDGWWAFRSDLTLCAVKLKNLTPANQESQTFCTSLSSLGVTDIDFTQITQVDSESRKRYVVLVSAPLGHVFSVASSGLQYEYPLPSRIVEPHSDVGQDSAGRQIFFWNYEDTFGSKPYLGAMRLNKGAEMLRPVEEGGGVSFSYPTDPANPQTDGHFGCTWRGVCVFTTFGNSLGVTTKSISAVTPANPCALTTASAHGFANGASVLIGGATGITSINGVFTITVTGTNSFTLNGLSCTGTYAANTANAVLNVATAPAPTPNRQEVVMVRPGHEIRRLAIHRTKTYDNGSFLLGYYATPRASISRDGRYIAYAGNHGIPELSSVWVVDVGVPTTTVRLEVQSVGEADTKAILNYKAPAGEGAATITVSASPDLSSPVVSASDGQTAASRQYVVSGLTAGTDYWFRITTGKFATQGQFRTSSALSGTGVLRVERGDGGTVQHGATSALGSSGASPLQVTVNRGVYYYNAGSGTQAVVVR